VSQSPLPLGVLSLAMNDDSSLPEALAEVPSCDRARSAACDVSRPASVPYYVKALAMGLPALCFGLTIRGWIDFLSHIPKGYADFRHLYATAYMVRTGHASEIYIYAAQKLFQDRLTSPANLALPFNHLAYESLIFLPFSYLSYTHAYLFWLSLNLLMLVVCFFALRSRIEPLKAAWRWLPLALFLGFIPLSAALEQGQDSIVLLTLFTFAYVSLQRGKDLLAGLLIGVGLFKFQLVLPIALLFFLWRKWRLVAGFATSGVICLSASLMIVGVAGFRAYGAMLRLMSSGLSEGLQTLYGVPPRWMANLRGFIFAISDGRVSPMTQTGLIVFVSLAVLLLCARYGPRCSSDQLLLAIITASLVSYHFLLHDMSILLLPMMVILSANMDAEADGESSRRWLFRSAAFVFAEMTWRVFPPASFFLMCLPLVFFWMCSLRISVGY
jgi:hypothetical protein